MKSIPLRAHEAAAYAESGETFQLRRVVNPQPVDAPSFVHYGTKSIVKEVASGQIFTTEQCIAALVQFAPYGAPGDTLAFKETWADANSDAGPCVCYKADYDRWYLPDGEDGTVDYSKYPGGVFANWASDLENGIEGKWQPSTRMPAWAVRWHPVITAVRLERVQDISEADARACGVYKVESIGMLDWYAYSPASSDVGATAKDAHMFSWNRDNPRTPWDSNPWTWVIDVEGAKA